MKEEVRRWWKYSKDDFDTAKYLFGGKRYKASVFFCQQAVEKGLKALYIKNHNKIKKIHDLVELGKDNKIPQNLLEYCKGITSAYIYSRYPDVKEEKKKIARISSNFLKYTGEILKWVKKNL